MADEITRYIEVTDTTAHVGELVGVHSVDMDWKHSQMSEGQSYRDITEDEARSRHPALFGIAPPVEAPDPETIAEQIAALQAQLAPLKPSK